MNNGHMTTQHNTKPIAKSHTKHTCTVTRLDPGGRFLLGDTTATPRASSLSDRHNNHSWIDSPPHWGRESSQIDPHPMGTPEPFSSWRHNSHASSHPMEKPEDHSTWTQTISPTGRVRPTTAWEHGGRPGGVARALCLRTSKTDSTRLKIGIESQHTHTPLGIEKLALKHPSTHTPWALR